MSLWIVAIVNVYAGEIPKPAFFSFSFNSSLKVDFQEPRAYPTPACLWLEN